MMIHTTNDAERHLLFALQLYDAATYEHSLAIGRYMEMLSDELRNPDVGVALAGQAGRLHDIGKLKFPQALLTSPAGLSSEEAAIVKLHPEHGALMVSAHAATCACTSAVRAHHERFDGTGYPRRLGGECIPLTARMVSVCDAFAVMTMGRPYQHAISVNEACAELSRGRDRQWDGNVVDAFVARVKRENYGIVDRLPATSLASSAYFRG